MTRLSYTARSADGAAMTTNLESPAIPRDRLNIRNIGGAA